MPEQEDRGHHEPPQGGEQRLHIFVNRRKFDEGDGVRPEMTGGEIAALVGVPRENAVIKREGGPEPAQIGIDERIHIKSGDHFLVTRKVVEGGSCP